MTFSYDSNAEEAKLFINGNLLGDPVSASQNRMGFQTDFSEIQLCSYNVGSNTYFYVDGSIAELAFYDSIAVEPIPCNKFLH